MSDAFDEVEEAIARDRAVSLWKSYGPWLIGAAVAAVAMVAAWEAWKWQAREAVTQDGRIFADGMKAAGTNNMPAAKAAFDKLAKDDDSFATLSQLQLAEIARAEGDPATAEAELSEAAKGEGALADAAVLKLAYLKADTVTLAELTKIVDPLVKKGGPLAALAGEVVAAKKLETGDVAGARADYQRLSLDTDAPRGMQSRIEGVLQIIQQSAPAAATPAPAASPAPSASPKAPQ